MYYLQGQTAQFTKHKTKLMVALYNSYVQASRPSQSTLANLAFTLQNIRQKRQQAVAYAIYLFFIAVSYNVNLSIYHLSHRTVPPQQVRKARQLPCLYFSKQKACLKATVAALQNIIQAGTSVTKNDLLNEKRTRVNQRMPEC